MTAIPGRFSFGVCYYPEHWPRDRWPGYARRMRELGIAYVRIAEFAWSRMEPNEGQFAWEWLDAAIESLHAEERKIVLCTPTAAPPAWLTRAHPEILPYDREGRVREFGSRKHYDHASPIYRAHSRRITTEIAKRYGDHPAVAGWQTDNEWGCHSTSQSYGGASAAAFPGWLRARYAALDALNEAWGTVFWSQEYHDWNQILPPNLTVTEPNPSHLLDYARFASDMIADFQAEQIAILRAHSPGRWITHNFMQHFGEFDHYRNAELLDFASWDSYPMGHAERSLATDAEKLRWARTGHPDWTSFNHDLYRGVKGSGHGFWVMEQGVGQTNWASSNCLAATGAAALWTAQAYAHGADCVSFFRWRAATVAQESMHSGLLRHDETLDRGGEEIAGLELLSAANGEVTARVVLLHDYESLWMQDAQPHAEGARYWRQVMLFYGALRGLGIDVDVRHPDQDLSAYDVIVAPALQLVGPERARRLEGYAERAKLVFGPRAGYRTPSGRVHEDGQPGPLRGALGCVLLNFDGMRPGLKVRVDEHIVETWAEAYRLTGAEAIRRYADGPLAGEAAVVRHANVTTIGAWSETLVTEILAETFALAGVPTVRLPEAVRVARRGGVEVWMNFNESSSIMPDGSTTGPVSFQMRG